MNKLKHIPDVVASLCILLFSYAAISKLIDVDRFRIQIGQSPMLTPISDIVSLWLPVGELVLALLLLLPKTRLIALHISFMLMVMFTTYIFLILNFSEHIPCSCGGVLGVLGWKSHLAFNTVFVALILIAIVVYDKQRFHSSTENETL